MRPAVAAALAAVLLAFAAPSRAGIITGWTIQNPEGHSAITLNRFEPPVVYLSVAASVPGEDGHIAFDTADDGQTDMYYFQFFDEGAGSYPYYLTVFNGFDWEKYRVKTDYFDVAIALANQQLSFSVAPTSFNASAPEPSSVALAGVGGGAAILGLARRRSKRRVKRAA